jgi:hypothetical protein
MQNIQDLKEKIFFESKNMIAILDKISNVDELISRQDLVDELANRISFLKLLEKNLEYFEKENFSSTEKNSENFSSQPFIESNYEVEEEEAIFNNQLNEIVEEELHETLVNFVEENADSETVISADIQEDKDIFNKQLEETDEQEIPDNTDRTLNFIDEERILANAEPENDDDIDEDMFSREHTEEEAVFNNQLNEIDEFENEISDDQGNFNDFDEEEHIRNNFDKDVKNEEKQEITETIPSIFDTEPIEEDLLIEENEEHFTVSEAMIEHGEMATDTSNVESIVTEIRHEAALEEKQETILAEINDRRKIVEIDRPVPEKENDKPASDESFENLEAYQQEKKIKLAHIKGLKAVQTLFDDDHLERTLPLEQTAPVEKKEDTGSILKTNIPTDFMEAEKKKPEFKLDLNDRIAFTKTLFGGSQSELNEVVNNLNSFRTLEDAKEYLSDLYYAKKWSKVDEYAQRLWILVENKFL